MKAAIWMFLFEVVICALHVCAAEGSVNSSTAFMYSILVIGGWDFPWTMEWYNPWNSSENRLLSTDLSLPRSAHVSAVLGDGRVVIAGGEVETVYWKNYLSSMVLFDPKMETLTEGPPMSTNRSHAAAAVANGVIYVCGGHNLREFLNSCERYQSKVWQPIANMSKARYILTMVGLDGMLYAIGGADEENNRLSLVEAYNIKLNTWTQKAPMSTAQWGLAAAVLGKSIIACNGAFHENVCEKYDVEGDTWSHFPSMQKKRRHFSMVTVGSWLVALGGRGEGISDTAEMYDPATGNWTLLDQKLLKRRYFHSAVVF